MTTKEYQNYIYPLIQRKLKGLEVIKEWTALAGFRNHYSPRVDLAVGPFSTIPGNDLIGVYNQILTNKNIIPFIKKIYEQHIENIGLETNNEIIIPDFEELISKNQNARCLLAIEIENKNSKKHIMGSLINAASLGRVGIGIAYNEKTMRTFIRIMNYLGFLKRVGKNSYDTTNFLIISNIQMEKNLIKIRNKNGRS